MRIAFVVPDDVTAWFYYRHLMHELLRRGAHVTVISASGPWVKQLEASGIEHVGVRYARFVAPFADLRLLFTLIRLFRERRFDIVQNFTVKANIYGATAAVVGGIPTIINTVEGAGILWSDESRGFVRPMKIFAEACLKVLKPRIRLYWFVNRFDRDLYVARGLADRDKSVVAISTGVDTHEFNPAALRAGGASVRSELSTAPNERLVTMVAGRLLKSKGIEDFLEIARQLREGSSGARAILVGPPEPDHPDSLDPSILERASESGLVLSLGFRSDVPALYAASDVVVVPTMYAEGIAKSVVEPMAMECPVVCSRTPAIAEMVVDGQDAILVRPGDVQSFTKAVVTLLDDHNLSRRIGMAARATVLERFDAEKQAREAVQDVYVDRLGVELRPAPRV